MDVSGWLQIVFFAAVVTALVAPLGGYMAKVFAGERTFAHPLVGPLERLIYRLSGVDPDREQSWLAYALCFLGFHALAVLVLYGLLRLQGVLPLNPQHLGAVAPDLAFNTAISFVTNTSWQSYAGESTLSYLAQMMGITVFSFLSAAAGIAVAIALIRGFVRHRSTGIGNFWVDQTRAVLYVLLPLSMIGAVVLAGLGIPQTLGHAANAITMEGARQTIALGPVASQEAIKLLSGDGGGFFNANSAHPFENPNAVANFTEMVLIFVIGAALTNTFGRMVGSQRQGWVLLAVMGILFFVGVTVIYAAEAHGNPALAQIGGAARRFVSAPPAPACSPKSRQPPLTAPSIRCTTVTCP